MNDFAREFAIANGRAPDKTSRNIVEFYTEPIIDSGASEKAGRKMFRDTTLIRIIIPGDMKSVVERLAHVEDYDKYAREYEAFKRSETLSEIGTPLEHWTLLTRAMVRQLKYANVHTVDSLSELSDQNIADIGMLGMRTLRNQAKAYLEAAKTGAVPARLVAENERGIEEIKNLKQALAEANMRYEQLLTSAGRNPAQADPVQPRAGTLAPAPIVHPAVNVVPDNTSAMTNKDIFALVERLCGLKVNTRKAAEEALAEFRTGA